MQDNQSFVRYSSPYQLLDLLARLFTVGIFSTTGGVKTWFELFLVIATLAACGYLIWWQAIFLTLILIFGALAAGLLTLVYPQILMTQQFTSEGFAVSALESLSRENIREATHLSGDALQKHKDTLLKAAKILQEHPTLLEDLTQLKSVFQNIEQDYETTQIKIQVEEEEAKEIERRKNVAEQERRKQKIKLDRQRQEAEQERQQQLAKQISKRLENERQTAAELERQRREVGFSGGHPPLNIYGTLTCPPDYPIKVTLNGTSDGYNGIIWIPEDGKRYQNVTDLKWCFRSIAEALADSGKYKLRRPLNS